jgi:hypothetical protein
MSEGENTFPFQQADEYKEALKQGLEIMKQMRRARSAPNT